MHVAWRVWVTAKAEIAAQRVCNRVLQQLEKSVVNLSMEPYPKTGGFVLNFEVALKSGTWADSVIEVIALGQRIGRQWTLYGDILHDPSGWCTDPAIVGVQAMNWWLLLNEAPSQGC